MDLVSFYQESAENESADFRFSSLKEFLKKTMIDGPVIDIGCGPGTLVKELTKDGYEVMGLEPNPGLYDVALRIKKKSGLPYDVQQRGIESLPDIELGRYKNFLLIDVLE